MFHVEKSIVKYFPLIFCLKKLKIKRHREYRIHSHGKELSFRKCSVCLIVPLYQRLIDGAFTYAGSKVAIYLDMVPGWSKQRS